MSDIYYIDPNDTDIERLRDQMVRLVNDMATRQSTALEQRMFLLNDVLRP